MKTLLILSGKGGTGKTTTAAAFVKFAQARAFADCDVDAPNLHLVTGMDIAPKVSNYYGSQKAMVDSSRCIGCQKCMENCRFDAIATAGTTCYIDQYACEGCGVCAYVCPQNAITLQDDIAGQLALYQDTMRVFSTAKLKMGRGNSGKLVSAVKSALTNAASEANLAIIDGSPGISCPVIASISGVNLVLIVAEPSISGLSDMARILKTTDIFQTKAVVCVNKYDASMEMTNAIEDFCQSHHIPYVGRIQYDKNASLAINAGISLAEIDSPAQVALKGVFDKTMALLSED